MEPLTTEAKDYLQRSVDDAYAKFVKAMARNRMTTVQHVVTRFGGGRILDAEPALAARLVDGILPFGAVVQNAVRSIAVNKEGMKALRARQAKLVAEMQKMERSTKKREFDRYIHAAAHNIFEDDNDDDE